jgi:hypothetical protein
MLTLCFAPRAGQLWGSQGAVLAAQWHSTASPQSTTGSLWFPPSLSAIFSGFQLPKLPSSGDQQAQGAPAAVASTLGEPAAAVLAQVLDQPEEAPSADLASLVETVRGEAPNSYESSRRISAILERVALQLDTLPPAHTTILVSALCSLERRDAIVDIMLEAVSALGFPLARPLLCQSTVTCCWSGGPAVACKSVRMFLCTASSQVHKEGRQQTMDNSGCIACVDQEWHVMCTALAASAWRRS